MLLSPAIAVVARRGLFLFLLAILGPTCSPETLVVATYNVENYGPANRLTEKGFESDYPKPEEEKRALRTAIETLRADVLALQEMGRGPYLDELQRDLRAEGLDYPYSALIEAEDVDRHVALLSRLRLKAIRRYTDLEFPYLGGRARVKRGLLETRVETSAGDLTIFVVHLKSRLTERPDDPQAAARRLAEAAAVRDCIRASFPDGATARFLLIGDCNDGLRSPALRRLQRRGTAVIARVLAAADSRGETWTQNITTGRRWPADLDHILVSPGLRLAVAGGVAHIYDGPGAAAASDHRPVYVTLVISPKP